MDFPAINSRKALLRARHDITEKSRSQAVVADKEIADEKFST
jgi:hypothetical protein